MATYCNAPSTIELSHSIAIPDTGILLSWSGAIAGTDNPILGYLIEYKDSIGDPWSSYSTVLSDLTAFMTTVTMPSTRGVTRYWRVTTLGENDSGIVGNRNYSTAVTCLTNNLPATPALLLDKSQIPYNGTNPDKTITFTITPNTSNDDVGETQTFYYATSLGGTKTNIANGGTVLINATTTFYLWSFDGLEYCTTPINATVTKNTIPSISAITPTPIYTTVGPNSKIMTTKLTMGVTAASVLNHSLQSYFQFEYSATTDFANPVTSAYITGSILPATTLITSSAYNGYYFKIRVKVVDQTFPVDFIEQLDTNIYYMPKLPNIYGTSIVLKPINELTSLPMSTYTLNGVNFYRHWFQYGCSSFSANNNNGYGTISSAKIYYNNNSSNFTNATVTNGTVGETLVNITSFTEATSPNTVSAQLVVKDEFNQEFVATTTTTNLTKLTDALVISNAVTYSGGTASGKVGLPVYDINDFTLSFANLKVSYPNSFNYSGYDPSTEDMYQKVSFLNSNQTIHKDDWTVSVNGSFVSTLTIKTRSTFGGGTTTGLLNATTKLYNTSTNDANFVIHIYDHFGIIHQLTLTTSLNIDFRATPTVINANNGLVDITGTGWTNPFLSTNYYYGVYKDQILNLRFNTLVFGDNNIVNGATDSIQVRIYIYENSNLIKTLTTTWNANSTISTYNLVLNTTNIGAITNKKILEIKLAAYDNTALESSVASQYSIGTFVVFDKALLPTIDLTQLTYGGAEPDFTILTSYDYAYDIVNSTYTGTYENIYAAKNVVIKLENYTPLTGTQETISLMSGIIPVGTYSPSDELIFSLTQGLSKQTITPNLVVTITFHDNTTITIASNLLRLKFGEPTVSVRANKISVNREYEDIPISESADNVLYVYTGSNTYKTIYLVHEYESVSHIISIDLSTSEIDGAVINGGSY